MPQEPGQISTADELLQVVERRLAKVVEGGVKANEQGEQLDFEYFRGQEHELRTMQDLLCVILDRPRTYYAN